jgi:hypothetical protein
VFLIKKVFWENLWHFVIFVLRCRFAVSVSEKNPIEVFSKGISLRENHQSGSSILTIEDDKVL